jgi:hypothetical protein
MSSAQHNIIIIMLPNHLCPLHSTTSHAWLLHLVPLTNLLFCNLQAWDAPDTGLIINERLVNCPPQLSPPLVQALFDEVGWATEDEPQVRQLGCSTCLELEAFAVTVLWFDWHM